MVALRLPPPDECLGAVESIPSPRPGPAVWGVTAVMRRERTTRQRDNEGEGFGLGLQKLQGEDSTLREADDASNWLTVCEDPLRDGRR